jgi:hypothetical protein
VAFKWIQGDESTAQKLFYNYAKQFDDKYTMNNSFPPNHLAGTDRGVTYFHRIFATDKKITNIYVYEGDGKTIPIYARTYGLYQNKLLLFMGLKSMRDTLQSGPIDELKTSHSIDRQPYKNRGIKAYIQWATKVERDIHIPEEHEKPDWNGVNPYLRTMPWPRGFINYEAETWEIQQYLETNYPFYYRKLHATEDKQSFKTTPEKTKAIKHLKEKLEPEAMQGKTITEFAYENEPKLDVYHKLAHAVNPGVKSELEKHGFKELEWPNDDEEAIALQDEYRHSPILEEAIELISQHKPKGALMLLDNTVKKSAWANIIKGANNMDWKKVIKKSSAMVQLDNIFSKPFDADMHKVITRWLIQMQRDFPNIFKRNEDLNDVKGVLSQMLEEITIYSNNTQHLDALRMKMKVEEWMGKISYTEKRVGELR